MLISEDGVVFVVLDEVFLAGLVSFGYTDCSDAGAFAKVSYYEEWIQERLNP